MTDNKMDGYMVLNIGTLNKIIKEAREKSKKYNAGKIKSYSTIILELDINVSGQFKGQVNIKGV